MNRIATIAITAIGSAVAAPLIGIAASSTASAATGDDGSVVSSQTGSNIRWTSPGQARGQGGAATLSRVATPKKAGGFRTGNDGWYSFGNLDLFIN